MDTVQERKEVTDAGRVRIFSQTCFTINLNWSKDVHKTLEQQIRSTEPIIIKVETQEERWAVRFVILPILRCSNVWFRLIEMLSCLHDILEHGFTVRSRFKTVVETNLTR
jgi:hypothetical protein